MKQTGKYELEKHVKMESNFQQVSVLVTKNIYVFANTESRSPLMLFLLVL